MLHDAPPFRRLTMLAILFSLTVACADNAAGPVNVAPVVAISAPAPGATIAESTTVVLQGSASDAEDGSLDGSAVVWSSDRDGELGTGDALTVPTLSAGNHQLSFSASDSRGRTSTATVGITVTPFDSSNRPPQVQITQPIAGIALAAATPVTLTGNAVDPEDGTLGGGALVWTSSLDGPLGTGDSLQLDSLSTGQHTLTLRASDTDGAFNEATLLLTVSASALQLDTVRLAGGLSQPVFLTYAPGDSSRIFVVEKTGKIRVIRNGTLLGPAFLDLTDSVTNGSEQGLLGLAFYPDYRTSGRFVVSYTSPHGRQQGGTSVIARYRVTANADLADATSGLTLLTLDQPYTNHNGGMIAFGPDGYLYIGFGDGGGGGDPLNTGQDRSDLYGSMLRLDVSGSGAYTIPPTNPYATSTAFRRELWNWGLRNPWRFSFDRLTGDLYIGDVGQGSFEEVNVARAGSTGGENYGWNTMEGLSCYQASSCNQSGLTLPVLDYDHGQGCSITGGYVYRGNALPSLRGHYFYADYCGGWVRSFRLAGGNATDRQDRLSLHLAVSSFGEDARGELYVVTLGGTVYRLVSR